MSLSFDTDHYKRNDILYTIHLILIKIGFFYEFEVAKEFGQRPCTIYSTPCTMCTVVQGLQPNFIKMARREFSVFILFSDTYTCTYVV